MCVFEEKMMFLFFHMRNVPSLQTGHGNFLILCQMVLLPNINFLISKQNKTPKTDPKNVKAVGWYCYSIAVSFTSKQSSTVLYK